MSGIQPVSVYTLRVPPGGILVPALPGLAAMFRVTMAAIDPSAEPELEDTEDQRPRRATLKIVRFSDDQFDDDEDDSDDDDLDDDEDEEDSDDDEEEENGGPSDKKSRKQKLLEALAADDEDEDEDMDEDDEDAEIDTAAVIKKLMQSKKGKGKAVDGEDDEDEDDESDESDVVDEVVLCTLDPEKHYQQPLDFVVGEGERIFFKVDGTHEVHLTGNYVMPIDDGQASLYDEDDEEEDYDLSPDEDDLDALMEEDEESDELDDMDDPRITEIASDEEALNLLVAAKGKGKGKNKRPADDSEEDLDALVAKSMQKEEPAVNGNNKKMTKAEKKAAKKLKKNDGEAVPATNSEKKPEATVNGSEKKTVQFAKNLEQGPTPSATPPAKKDDVKKEDVKKAGANATLGVRAVNGVTVDDRKVGSGPAAKKNSKVEMRYIGKLENGKVFDSNKSGKPFGFKLGTGEVIKGWDIGLDGISAGGERRITIPAHLAYGKKALPGIPANSTLIFDVKCLSVK